MRTATIFEHTVRDCFFSIQRKGKVIAYNGKASGAFAEREKFRRLSVCFARPFYSAGSRCAARESLRVAMLFLPSCRVPLAGRAVLTPGLCVCHGWVCWAKLRIYFLITDDKAEGGVPWKPPPSRSPVPPTGALPGRAPRPAWRCSSSRGCR